MSNQEILEKAIQKAIDSGWDAFGTESQQIDVEVVVLIDGELQPDIDVDKPGIYIRVHRHHGTYSVSELIFNHNFAKVLWGEEVLGIAQSNDHVKFNGLFTSVSKHGWKYHLQQTVIADDPIKYLGENL